LPRGTANETGNVFERKKAAKRNVANRPLARDVGLLFELIDSLLVKQLREIESRYYLIQE